ncbi:MAG: DUF3108 domain-containing protein [Bacteroidales bacterium]
MHKIASLLIISLSLLSLPTALYPLERDSAGVERVGESSFKEGEVLSFAIKYEWGIIKTDVGEATATVATHRDNNGNKLYKAVVQGSSFKFYDMIFKVREYFESHIDIATGRPKFFHRDVVEGRYTIKNWITFNDDHTLSATIARKRDPVRDTLLIGDHTTFDLVSLLYHIRDLDLKKLPVGIPSKATFVIDREIYDIFYTFLGKEVKKIPGLGKFNTLKFSTKLIVGEVFTGKEEMLLWVSDDSSKVLLLFESPIIVGKVAGRLKGYENLKYPLTSKIDE